MAIPSDEEYENSIDELMNDGYTFIPNPDPRRDDGFYNWGDGAHLFRQNAMTTYATQRRPDGLWELYGKPEEYQEYQGYQGYQDYKGYNNNNNRYKTEQVGGKKKYKTKSSKSSNRKTKKNKRSRKNKISRKYKRS